MDRVIEVAGSSLSQSLRATRFGGEPGANPEELIESSFQAVATQAKENCLVSRLLKTEVTLTARRWPEDEEPVDK